MQWLIIISRARPPPPRARGPSGWADMVEGTRIHNGCGTNDSRASSTPSRRSKSIPWQGKQGRWACAQTLWPPTRAWFSTKGKGATAKAVAAFNLGAYTGRTTTSRGLAFTRGGLVTGWSSIAHMVFSRETMNFLGEIWKEKPNQSR